MAKEKAPAFQFYPKDFLTDSHVAAMTLPELGAYIRLLCLCWLDRSLPAEVPTLARLCKVPAARFARLWPALKPCFAQFDGRLVQPRMEREREKQESYRAMKAAAGQRGGRSQAEAKQKLSRSQANGSSPISDLQSPSSSPEHVQAFERFWAIYPKHSGRKACEAFWQKLNPDAGLAMTICDGAETYRAHAGDWKPQFIKAPIRWLEGAHWDDELPAAPAVKDTACHHQPTCPDRWACDRLTRAEALGDPELVTHTRALNDKAALEAAKGTA